MAKKKEVKNERAKSGSGVKHDKHAPCAPHAEDETGGIVEIDETEKETE